jgi:LytS/YehU family sensor histidine kinase
MYVIVNHKMKNAPAFWAKAHGSVIPPLLTLQGVYPSADNSAAVCLWQTPDVESVKKYLVETFENWSENEYVEVNEELALGLTSEAAMTQKMESIRRQMELEMKILRAQMNPHFIFNSLNSINRFILNNNTDDASSYLTKFSKLIRLILQNSQFPLIALESEVEALQLYLELESLRFEQRFDFAIRGLSELEPDFIRIPPMLIQPYVENAIWHGLMHKAGRGRLSISFSLAGMTLVCVISDDGVGRQRMAELNSKSATHKPMGMSITSSRLSMFEQVLSSDAISIRDLVDANGKGAGTEVTLKIPITYD